MNGSLVDNGQFWVLHPHFFRGPWLSRGYRCPQLSILSNDLCGLLHGARHYASPKNYQYSSQHRVMKFFFLDQLWRLVNSSKLENKHGKWKFANNSWIIPEEGKLGYIEDSDTNHVLTVTDYNSGSNIFLTVQIHNYKIKF